MRHRVLCGVVFLSLSLAAVGRADPLSDALSQQSMYGINQSSAALTRYEFAAARQVAIGTVRDASGASMPGINAAAYFPGFQNIFALWQSSVDGKNKLVYIDVTTAVGTVVASDVEGGRFTGAVGLATPTNPWTVFAVQVQKVKPPSTISGLLNINPNNNDNNEFTLTRGDTSQITRDDLAAKDAAVDASGTYYQGAATYIHVKPKGNGNQNGLMIDGVAYPLQNSNTYDFSGSMQVRLYNDKVNNGKAMGHWWLQVISGTAYINGNIQVLTPNRIAIVDQKTGVVTEVMRLTRAYAALASTDGQLFYTTAGQDLYKIDTAAQTETRIGTMQMASVPSMEFVGSFLMSYDITNMVLGPINATNGQNAQSPQSLGLGTLGVILFTPTAQVPAARFAACD